jgi:hypothetical protein
VKGVNSSVMYLIHCKNLCKCHNVLPTCATVKEKIKQRKKGKMEFKNMKR